MLVHSYIRVGQELVPVEVELNLIPGLPQISFLGLPDAALRESAIRIRSALREQNFTLPQSQQILVHLRPSHLKKTSRGLDLAVAAALLWETGQVPYPTDTGLPCLYGELTLKGEVLRPDDMDEIHPPPQEPIWTGKGEEASLPFAVRRIQELKDLATGSVLLAPAQERTWRRPAVGARRFPKAAAEVAGIVAAGEHSALFAGPPGSGKSTLAEAIPSWIAEPEPDAFQIARRLNRQVGRDISWRPVLKPHHSITPLAMIGGGSALWAGEIARAHGGVLIMDELLEFNSEIQESLREPVEQGLITIVRAGGSRTFPARLLLLATTNLCACGRFVPKRQGVACRCSRKVRQRTLGRLKGPFADRFAIMSLTDEWSETADDSIPSGMIAARVQKAIAQRMQRGQNKPNAFACEDAIEATLTDWQRKTQIMGLRLSRRRKAALLRVARTIADLDGSEVIGNRHLERAVHHTQHAHRLLEEWQD